MTAQVPVSTTNSANMLKRTYGEKKKPNPKQAGQAQALRRY